MKKTGTFPAASLGIATIYTCPMHPQIRRDGPGHCPICGMTLEPLVETAADQPNADTTDISRRFWIGLDADDPCVRAGNGKAIFRRSVSIIS